MIDFGLHGGITREDPEVFDECDTVVSERVTSFNMFTAYEQDLSNGFIGRVFKELAARDAVVVLHTEEQSVIGSLTERLKQEGKSDSKWYPSSRPPYTGSMAAADGDIVAEPGHGEFVHREPVEWDPFPIGS